MIGGFITKLLGMIIKIVMSRLMGSEGIGLLYVSLTYFFAIYWTWAVWSTYRFIKDGRRR